MAEKSKEVTPRIPGKPFPKGWEGGPGRPLLADDVKQFKEKFKPHLDGTLLRLLTMNQGQLHKIHTSPDSKAYELIIARFLQMAINFGDVQRFTLIMDRVLGKMALPAELKPLDGPPPLDEEQKQINKERLLHLLVQLKSLPGDAPCNLIPNSLPLSQELLAPLSPPPSGTES